MYKAFENTLKEVALFHNPGVGKGIPAPVLDEQRKEKYSFKLEDEEDEEYTRYLLEPENEGEEQWEGKTVTKKQIDWLIDSKNELLMPCNGITVYFDALEEY